MISYYFQIGGKSFFEISRFIAYIWQCLAFIVVIFTIPVFFFLVKFIVKKFIYTVMNFFGGYPFL